MLAEGHAPEEGDAVTHQGGGGGQQQGLLPDFSNADHHQDAKEKARIGKARHGVESAVAGDLVVDDAGEHGKIDADHHKANVEDWALVEQGEQGLGGDVAVHHPGGAVDIELLHGAAVFIAAQDARRGEEQHPADLRQQDTAEGDGQQYDGG